MVDSVDTEALVRDNLPLVARHLRQLAGRLPPHVDRDDLAAAGLTALVTCARTYDPDRIRSFAGFASARIRWAMLDELRELDWAPRSTRIRVRNVEAARQRLAIALGRSPTSVEIAETLEMAPRDVDAATGNANKAAILSLQATASGAMIDSMADHRLGPEDALLLRERIGYLRDAVESLPVRLQTVVVRHFLQDRPIAEIAAELGVTESRVCQIRVEALDLLRDGINSQLDPEAMRTERNTRGPVSARRRAAYYARIAACGDLRSRLATTARNRREGSTGQPVVPTQRVPAAVRDAAPH
ncbi:MAG TPA: sigma-70 family RNA polymerase sigma factor [Pseudonocardiaceae bacterium]|nr:sigma-70 family RNA polymerase sigma factor [Pseudonocardiaceae bacterium]